MTKLISITQAVEQGIDRLRKPIWKLNEFDHIKIYIVNGCLCPWCHIYSALNRAINKQDPIGISITEIGSVIEEEWEVYDGHLPESDEYKNMEEEIIEFYKGENK